MCLAITIRAKVEYKFRTRKAMLTLRRHIFFTTAESEPRIEGVEDEYGDSFARDLTVGELKEVQGLSFPVNIPRGSPQLGLRLDACQVQAQLQCQGFQT